jgi:O-antigen ligase
MLASSLVPVPPPFIEKRPERLRNPKSGHSVNRIAPEPHFSPLLGRRDVARAAPRRILVAILTYSICTVWVREGWAVSVLQLAVFACAAILVCRPAGRKADGLFLIPFAGMCLWSTVQSAVHWTVVRSQTGDAVLYWLTACAVAWLGYQACLVREERRRFLNAALAVGSVVALLSVVQLFTSPGRVFWLFESGYKTRVIGPFVSPNSYAAFAELLVPVALTLAFESKANRRLYLMVAAALVASVVAGGSRAGTILVVAESAAAFLLYHPARRGLPRESRRGPLIGFAALVAAFTLVVGYGVLWGRFLQPGNPWDVRREFLASSVAMLRAQPLHGFGLGTWASVYPQFATIDVGAIANHAHNEWVQWAAEGGLPALGLMLGAVFWVVRPAIRSVWGIGVLAVFLHSLVDYPFLRLGLAVWTFAFWGGLAAYRRSHLGSKPARETDSRGTGLRSWMMAVGAVPVLLWGIYSAAESGWADTLYHRATRQSLQGAIRLRPSRAEYYFALSEMEPDGDIGLLERAIARNPYFTRARIRLALEMEMLGRPGESERLILEAALHDRQFLPAWTAANFYFRRNRVEEFWSWARAAAQISYDDARPLFDLCFRVTNDGREVLDRVVGRQRRVERQYLAYLVAARRWPDAHFLAARIAGRPEEADRDPLLAYIDAALAAGQFVPAFQIWQALGRRRLPPGAPPEPALLANGDFAHEISNRAFDWRVPATPGVEARQTNEGGPRLYLALSGNEPERCEILSHPLALERGGAYVLRFQYRTSGLPKQTGLYWSLDNGREYPIDASEAWQFVAWPFEASDEAERLSLGYRRLLGTTRVEGLIALRGMVMERANKGLAMK